MRKRFTFQAVDVELNTDCCSPHTNAELTLTLRLPLQQINPKFGAFNGTGNDGKGKEREIVKWSPDIWREYKKDIVRIAEPFWSRKFWLINENYKFPFKLNPGSPDAYYPNIECCFKLVVRDALPADPLTIKVVRLAPGAKFVEHKMLFSDQGRFMEPKMHLTKSVPDPVLHGVSWTVDTGILSQRSLLHEIGHILVLSHVAAGTRLCPWGSDLNRVICYGTNDYEKHSLMGGGEELRPEHAYAWQQALHLFPEAGEEDWPVEMKRPSPKHPMLITSSVQGGCEVSRFVSK